MKKIDPKIIRENIGEKLSVLKAFSRFGTPEQGWIKTIRMALGMSSAQLGKRAGMDRTRVSRLESAEQNGNLTISSLQKIGKGLGMKFVYGFVPESDLDTVVRRQAEKVVAGRLERLDNTMKLEHQGLSEEEKRRSFEHMVEKLLMEDPKELWDEQ